MRVLMLICLLAVLFRPARRDDLCPVHQGHGHVRASDDVFHHSALGLLHRLGVWRRHHADAVLPAHPVGFFTVFLKCLEETDAAFAGTLDDSGV